MKTMKRKGFTLVELLVVIAILAILAGVGVAGYTAFIERAYVSNDQNTAAQLNQFLVAYNADHTSKHYGKDINEGNIREITQEILDLSGLDDLVPQSLEHGYHFYYDLQEDKYVVGKLNEQGLLETLVHAADNNGAHLGSCFTEDGRYFLIDTAGSDLADIVNGLYEAKTEADIQAALEKASALADEPSQVISKIQDYVASVNVIIEGTQYVTNAEGTTNVVFTDGTTWVGTDVVVVGNPEATGSGFVVNNSGSTIVIVVPDSVKYIEVGAMNTSGNTVVIVINKPSSEVANMANGSFTNSTLELEDGDFTVTDDGHITNADGSTKLELKYENAFVDFTVVVENTDTTKQIYDAEGNKTNSGYVAWDLDEFLLKFDAVGEDASIPATGLENATWEIVNDVDFARLEGNKVIFDKSKTPSQDIVVKATATNAKGEVVTREFTNKIVYIRGAEFTIGGDKVNGLDKVANLVCDNLSGTTFAVVPTFDYSYNNTGIKLATDLFLSFELTNHVHGPECCPHTHVDGECDNLRCSHDCAESGCPTGQCTHLHSDNDYACCGHVCGDECKTLNCTHEGLNTHLNDDGTKCTVNCSHGTSHARRCCYIYYFRDDPEKVAEFHTHGADCCVGTTYHSSTSNMKYCCKICSDAGSTTNHYLHKNDAHQCVAAEGHEHGIACCSHMVDKASEHSADCCLHLAGYHSESEYTCSHNAQHTNSCYDINCTHTHDPKNCSECTHTTHDENCLATCDFVCTKEQDCLTCDHVCDSYCIAGCKIAPTIANNAIIGRGNANGKLTINVGKEGAYSYTFDDITLNFYGDFETDIKGNITHLGNVNTVKVEDLFSNGVPTDAKIYIYDAKHVNHATDNFMFPNRTLLTLKSEASAMGETFYVEDNVIEYKNGAWEEIKFYGTGEVYIAVVANEGVRLSNDVAATVVAGKNVRTHSDITGATNYVILNNIEMPTDGTLSFTGAHIYGNHNTFDITNAKSTGINGIIVLNNSYMQDLRVIGALYPQIAISGEDPYGANAVLATGNTTIENCYIANTRAPLASGYENNNTHNITLKNTILFGGRYANIEIRGGTLTFEGTVMTINQPHTDYEGDVTRIPLNERVAGLGITVWFEAKEAKLNGVSNLVQYNFMSENFDNIPDVTVDYDEYQIHEKLPVSNLFDTIFNDSQKYGDYYFGTAEDRYINASIIGQDLGTLASNPLISSAVKIPTGNRITFDKMSTSYQYVKYEDTVVNGSYIVYLHTYGLINNAEVTDEAQDKMFADSKNAEFIYSPWSHTVDGKVCGAYDFGNDNEIIPLDLIK